MRLPISRLPFPGALRGAVVLVLGAVASADVAAQAYVRVNQVGYESGIASRAYVMSASALSNESFKVLSASGATAASGKVGATTGTWGSYSVYPIDFTVSGAGTYSIAVSGAVSASSPPFSIASPANLYGKALQNALSFYENERDGPNYIASALRSAPAHLNDAHATIYKTPPVSNDTYTANLVAAGGTMDASGGWFDAGDYVKFVQTHSYTVGVMLSAIRDFPAQLGAGSSASNFTNEAKFGLDWLLKMWNDSTQTLYYQVGVGIDFSTNNILSDHDFWRLPQADDNATPTSAPGFKGVTQAQLAYIRNRPVFIAAPAGSPVSPNLAGRLAADFALCFQVFKTTDAALADKCLLAAEHVFALADTAPSGKLLTTSPFDFYGESVWQDDLEWGATELNLALRLGGLPNGLPQTDPAYYLTQAANWANTYIAKGNFDSLNLYDVAGLAHYDLHRAIGLAGNPKLAVSQATLLANLKTLLQTNAPKTADPFDAVYTWKYGDSASHLSGLSAMASEIGYLAGDATQATTARRQAAGVLGANAWGVSMIVGDGTVFPYCPQHQPANLLGSHDGTGVVIAGAVVEGPSSSGSGGSLTAMQKCGSKTTYQPFDGNGAVYVDRVQSYSTDEPAIDLTAASMLMFGWRIAGTPAALP